jgi:membrane protein
VLRWPLLFVALLLFFGLLHRGLPTTPGAPRARAGWVSWGGVVGVLLWFLGSGAFSWYNANFATDRGGYGALGTVIVFLAWLWLGHLALLVGVEIDLRVGISVRPDLLRALARHGGRRGAGRIHGRRRDQR